MGGLFQLMTKATQILKLMTMREKKSQKSKRIIQSQNLQYLWKHFHFLSGRVVEYQIWKLLAIIHQYQEKNGQQTNQRSTNLKFDKIL